MPNPSELIEKLEAAETGSRELDREIMAMFYSRDRRYIGCTCWPECCPNSRHLDDVWVDPDTDKWVTTAHDGFEFTSSLDAILALVERKLPGWEWHVLVNASHGESGCSYAGLTPPDGSRGPAVAIPGKRAPVGLCIALLRALSHIKEGSSHG